MRSFDWNAYGKAVMSVRKDGLRCSRKKLADRVMDDTGAFVTEGMIERTETGRSVPSADTFFAINMTLFGDPMPSCLKERGFRCLP